MFGEKVKDDHAKKCLKRSISGIKQPRMRNHSPYDNWL